jgi:hypothetical protein
MPCTALPINQLEINTFPRILIGANWGVSISQKASFARSIFATRKALSSSDGRVEDVMEGPVASVFPRCFVVIFNASSVVTSSVIKGIGKFIAVSR